MLNCIVLKYILVKNASPNVTKFPQINNLSRQELSTELKSMHIFKNIN